MVNLIQLPVEELRCFFINIFNVLVLHARVTSKVPLEEGHIVPRCSFFRNTSYQVCLESPLLMGGAQYPGVLLSVKGMSRHVLSPLDGRKIDTRCSDVCDRD